MTGGLSYIGLGSISSWMCVRLVTLTAERRRSSHRSDGAGSNWRFDFLNAPDALAPISGGGTKCDSSVTPALSTHHR